MENVLVTGATGFVGQIVQERWSHVVTWPREADLTDQEVVSRQLARLLEERDFAAVLHLAAQSSPQRSIEDPAHTWSVNLMGTVHLMEALKTMDWKGRFLFVSTGASYAHLSGLIDEDSPVEGRTPYHLSKLAAESAVLEWGRRSGTHAMIVRPFNHTGPGQSTHYFLPSMARQIAALPDSGGEIEVGNLDVHKDFIHVHDVIDGYRALLQSGRSQQIYNLAAGRSHLLRDTLQILAQKSGKQVKYVVSEERYRPEESEPYVVDTRKLQDHTGWKPRIGIEELTEQVMKDWMTTRCREKH